MENQATIKPMKRSETEELERRFEEAKAEFYNVAASLADLGSAKARDFSDKIASQASGLKREVRDVSAETIEQLRRQVAAIESDVSAHVRQKPVQSLAIAAGVGFLLALLMRR